MLWEVDIYPAEGQPDLLARDALVKAAALGLGAVLEVAAARGYLLQGELGREQVDRLAAELLADPVVERTVVAEVGDAALSEPPPGRPRLVHVLPKPGVMDPVAQSAKQAIADFGLKADAVRTLKKYWLGEKKVPGTFCAKHPPGRSGKRCLAPFSLSDEQLDVFCSKVLSNDAIEQVVAGPLAFDRLEVGSPYEFRLATVPIRGMDDAALKRLSREGQLFLSLVEMQAIQRHFRELDRDPTDVELETLAGRIRYRGPQGERQFDNMLRETIFAATREIREQLGEDDWCVSVFADNAGVIRFDERYNIVFKVETHNHPSALEPYGGANTGIGGVIRDPMGTGLGAFPVCNTDVFCFAPPDTPYDSLPAGVLHPRLVMQGVVAGVRDYGNRMGIPTVNGALYFDPRYLGNPLVYCGNVGIIPREMSFKDPKPGDLVVAVGGRTGRDGIHGATFSSAELTHESDELSGGAVQIGNAITEKMLLDVLMVARDRGLYHAVTDCGAGGFSSAVGEMGERIGAEVWLDRVPLKYEGLSYTEIWISEAQERMVLAVPEEKWPELADLCGSEGVEATVIGRYVPTGRLALHYQDHPVADLSMEFLHHGRPPVVREALYDPPAVAPLHSPLPLGEGQGVRAVEPEGGDYTAELLAILGSLNVCSKHWVVRQYDHEVQGGSVLKPLVGVENDGPGDAAVIRPVLTSRRGIAIACGMNPRYADLDTYHMAASAIDEAVRNCVAVGADPKRTAILDNFCWGNTDRAETLGSLVHAALACHDVAVALGTPFISGKDSLNNEFRPEGADEPIAVPPSLLISAIGQVEDVGRCVSMDLKEPGNHLYLVGLTKNELGGSHFAMVRGLSGGEVPKVDAPLAREIFDAVHRAMKAGLVRACHDLSEGGLAVAAAEMAFAGGLGATIRLDRVPRAAGAGHPAVLLFSESNSRLLCEVRPDDAPAFEEQVGDVPFALVGEVTEAGKLEIVVGDGAPVVSAELAALRAAWRRPLDW